MAVGFKKDDDDAPRDSPLTGIRELWRMKGVRKVLAAALYRHPAGTELRVYAEPESAADLFHSQVERFDVGVLKRRATALREVLREQGWLDLPPIMGQSPQ